MKALGRHILVEYYYCDPDVLDNVQEIERLMKEAAVRSGSTIVESIFRKFDPHGISGVVMIAESHLAIHSWPEHRYAAVDIFTCGENVDSLAAYEFLKDAFGAQDAEIRELLRGDHRMLGNNITHKPVDSLGPLSRRA
jgi:S-adenosylmethionine decarboxylase